MTADKQNIKTNHRFLDEAGDTALYGQGKKAIIGSEGGSGCFNLRMFKFKEPLEPLCHKIFELQNQIANDPYYQVPSVQKKKMGSGYYFSAFAGVLHLQTHALWVKPGDKIEIKIYSPEGA